MTNNALRKDERLGWKFLSAVGVVVVSSLANLASGYFDRQQNRARLDFIEAELSTSNEHLEARRIRAAGQLVMALKEESDNAYSIGSFLEYDCEEALPEQSDVNRVGVQTYLQLAHYCYRRAVSVSSNTNTVLNPDVLFPMDIEQRLANFRRYRDAAFKRFDQSTQTIFVEIFGKQGDWPDEGVDWPREGVAVQDLRRKCLNLQGSWSTSGMNSVYADHAAPLVEQLSSYLEEDGEESSRGG